MQIQRNKKLLLTNDFILLLSNLIKLFKIQEFILHYCILLRIKSRMDFHMIRQILLSKDFPALQAQIILLILQVTYSLQ